MYDDVVELLKAHEYFRSVSDAALGEIAHLGTVTNYEAGAARCGAFWGFLRSLSDVASNGSGGFL